VIEPGRGNDPVTATRKFRSVKRVELCGAPEHKSSLERFGRRQVRVWHLALQSTHDGVPDVNIPGQRVGEDEEAEKPRLPGAIPAPMRDGGDEEAQPDQPGRHE
jgi:hypothetical protein